MSEQPLQVVNLDLYKASFEDEKYSEHLKPEGSKFKKFTNPFMDDDYEEITQTIENGVVVEEVRKTLKNKSYINNNIQISHTGDTGAHYDMKDINENFETKDIDEEEQEIGVKIQAHYLKTRNKNMFMQNSSFNPENAQKNNSQIANLMRVASETFQHPTGSNEPVSLLEESQEIILFQSDSKTNSPRLNKSQNRKSAKALEKVDFSTSLIKNLVKEEMKQSPNKPVNYVPVSQLVDRESPGPKRDMLTHSLEKKEITDNNSLQDEPANDDGSSESSSDILPSAYDIRKMVPYDQRKDLTVRDQPPSDMKRKLNINYEELEDSGSDGSGDLGREDPNHLASIIEEEEEATEYQRSRSRSKSNSSSPITSTSNIILDNRAKHANVQIQVSDKKNQTTIKEENVNKKDNSSKPKLPKEESKKYPERERKTFDSPIINLSANEIESIINQRSIEDRQKAERLRNNQFSSEEQKQGNIANFNSDRILENRSEQKPSIEQKEVFDSKSSNKKEKKGSSPERSKTAKRSESEKAIGFPWNASKNLKIIYSILQDIGDEKHISFGEFMYFYFMLIEISNSSKGSINRDFTSLSDNLNKNPNKIEVNQPHFLWAFMNPDRLTIVKKKIVKDVLKASLENKSKGRKILLDSLEEVIRNSESSSDTQRNMRLTFNYPGTKRALINFSNLLSKIDGRTTLARDISSFIEKGSKESEFINRENLDRQVKFNDPIKGLEKDEELEDYGANSRDNYYDQRPSKNRDINPLIEDFNTEEVLLKETKSSQQTSQISQSVLSESQAKSNKKSENYSSKYESPQKEFLKQKEPSEQISKLKINYEEIERAERTDKNQLNVYNMKDSKEPKKIDSQLKKYNKHTNSSENKLKFAKYLETSEKSEDTTKSLQYKVPINSVAKEKLHSSKDIGVKNAPTNVFSLRKHDLRNAQQFDEYDKPRDTTPHAKSIKSIENPMKSDTTESKVKKEKSIKRAQSSTKKHSKHRKQKSPKRYKHNFKPTNDSISSKQSSKRSSSSKKKTSKKKFRKEVYYDSQEEQDQEKRKSKRKSRQRYESSTSEEKEPKRKIIIENHKSQQSQRNKSTNRRYEEDEQLDKNSKQKEKRGRKSRERTNKSSTNPQIEQNLKKRKTTLFQVDINMDSKIVRISIHEGDNIDKIVQKFNDIFNLKSKQISLLTQRLKTQYDEMTSKNYESYDY